MLRDGAAYLESLRDGREVWYRGERVADITTHAVLGRCVANRAREYDLHSDPRYAEHLAFTAEWGERCCIGWRLPRTKQHLVERRQALETFLHEAASGVGDVLHAFGVGGTGILHVLYWLAQGPWRDRVERRYVDNIAAYFERCVREDLSLSVGSNDAKGDRARLPFEQDDPDMYTRVVEERPDGIVLRGVKKVCTAVAYSDEVLICTNFKLRSQIRTPAARERMAERYTFLCALPLNAPGLKVLCRPSDVSLRDSRIDHPVSWYDEIDGMVVLEDVFVPWERVLVYQDVDFYLGWRGCGASNLSNFDLCISTASRMELLVGAGSLATRANGVIDTPPAQARLAQLYARLEALRLFIRAAEEQPDGELCPGLMLPSELYCHLGLDVAFEHLSEMMAAVADIMGGATVTMQASEDLLHSVLGPLLAKYFSRPAFDGALVVRLALFILDLTCSRYAMREELYVRLSLGDVLNKRQTIYRAADFGSLEQKVLRELERAADTADSSHPPAQPVR